eukprot:1672116-Alexandrium_andersonii.AAC.1
MGCVNITSLRRHLDAVAQHPLIFVQEHSVPQDKVRAAQYCLSQRGCKAHFSATDPESASRAVGGVAVVAASGVAVAEGGALTPAFQAACRLGRAARTVVGTGSTAFAVYNIYGWPG